MTKTLCKSKFYKDSNIYFIFIDLFIMASIKLHNTHEIYMYIFRYNFNEFYKKNNIHIYIYIQCI